MVKSRKRTKLGHHYQTMAAGYQILRSPLAGLYNAAAEHYQESDLPYDPAADAHARPDFHAAPKLEPGNGRD